MFKSSDTSAQLNSRVTSKNSINAGGGKVSDGKAAPKTMKPKVHQARTVRQVKIKKVPYVPALDADILGGAASPIETGKTTTFRFRSNAVQRGSYSLLSNPRSFQAYRQHALSLAASPRVTTEELASLKTSPILEQLAKLPKNNSVAAASRVSNSPLNAILSLALSDKSKGR